MQQKTGNSAFSAADSKFCGMAWKSACRGIPLALHISETHKLYNLQA